MKAHVVAFAKLNLFLAVLGRRDDGYHEIDSVAQTIDLSDNIEIGVRSGHRVIVENSLADIQGPDLAERAASALLAAKAVRRRVDIRIEKRIPAGAGLGGGSSDAAAVLRTLDRLTPPLLSPWELQNIAAQIGSDVALFLVGGRVRVSGRGELVTPFPRKRDEHYVVVTPTVRCPTGEVYAAWAAHRTPASGTGLLLGRNDLYAPALHVRPEITRYHDAVAACGGLYAGLSGSGSSFYAAFADPQPAARCADALSAALPECSVYRCRPTEAGSLWLEEEEAQ